MPVRDVFKFSRKTFFNPTGWIALESIKTYNRTIWGVLKPSFSTPKADRRETFDEAMTRQNLTEQDIQRTRQRYRYFALFFVILGVISFCYSFYLLFSRGSFTGFFLGMAVCSLFFAETYQYDFWALQIERRQLGLTFADWKKKY